VKQVEVVVWEDEWSPELPLAFNFGATYLESRTLRWLRWHGNVPVTVAASACVYVYADWKGKDRMPLIITNHHLQLRFWK
jgi:hypothetical protein